MNRLFGPRKLVMVLLAVNVKMFVHSFIYFHRDFSSEEVVWAVQAALDEFEMLQSLIVLQASHQDVSKQVRRCNHVTWSLVDLWIAFWWMSPAGLASPIFSRSFWRVPTMAAGISRFVKGARHSGHYEFHSCHFVAKCHAVNSSQNSHICRFYLR